MKHFTILLVLESSVQDQAVARRACLRNSCLNASYDAEGECHAELALANSECFMCSLAAGWELTWIVVQLT